MSRSITPRPMCDAPRAWPRAHSLSSRTSIRRARLHAFESLTHFNLSDARLRVVNDLQKSFGVFHTAPLGKAKGKLPKAKAKVKTHRALVIVLHFSSLPLAFAFRVSG